MGRPRRAAHGVSLALAMIVALPWQPMLSAVETLRDAPQAAAQRLLGPESRQVQKDGHPGESDPADRPTLPDEFDDEERAGDEDGPPTLFSALTLPPSFALAMPTMSRCLPAAGRSSSSSTVHPVPLRC